MYPGAGGRPGGVFPDGPSSAAAENSLNCWSKYRWSPVTFPIRDQVFIAMKSASTHDHSDVSSSLISASNSVRAPAIIVLFFEPSRA